MLIEYDTPKSPRSGGALCGVLLSRIKRADRSSGRIGSNEWIKNTIVNPAR